jgi:hypothetical protein
MVVARLRELHAIVFRCPARDRVRSPIAVAGRLNGRRLPGRMTSEIMDCGREVAKVLKLDDRWWAVEGRRMGSSDGVAPAADPAGRMASVMIEKALNMAKTGG